MYTLNNINWVVDWNNLVESRQNSVSFWSYLPINFEIILPTFGFINIFHQFYGSIRLNSEIVQFYIRVYSNPLFGFSQNRFAGLNIIDSRPPLRCISGAPSHRAHNCKERWKMVAADERTSSRRICPSDQGTVWRLLRDNPGLSL